MFVFVKVANYYHTRLADTFMLPLHSAPNSSQVKKLQPGLTGRTQKRIYIFKYTHYNMSGLKNKVVVVTGASGGIGRATAVEFARVGARLCISGRNEERLKETKKQCVQAGQSEENVLIVTADVRKQEDITNIINKTIEAFKQLDVLVNNAASLIAGGFEDIDVTMFEEMLNNNVTSVFSLSKAALPHILQTKGNIVNVASITGTRPYPEIFAYATSKAAINHMTQMMAVELGPKGVRVNSVNPGVTVTGLFITPGSWMSHAPDRIDEFYTSLASANPMGRVGKPEETARAIRFLASDDASYISGNNMLVDGAWHASIAGPTVQLEP